ncbi:MAG: hypothetical protein HQ513_06475, partial [Rhodospirillales bacterium]|nr:hypothetical protein [Rhodospirillales bacterium]
MKRKTLLSLGLAGVLALGGMLATLGAATAEVESKDPIILTIHDWTGQY